MARSASCWLRCVPCRWRCRAASRTAGATGAGLAEHVEVVVPLVRDLALGGAPCLVREVAPLFGQVGGRPRVGRSGHRQRREGVRDDVDARSVDVRSFDRGGPLPGQVAQHLFEAPALTALGRT